MKGWLIAHTPQVVTGGFLAFFAGWWGTMHEWLIWLFIVTVADLVTGIWKDYRIARNDGREWKGFSSSGFKQWIITLVVVFGLVALAEPINSALFDQIHINLETMTAGLLIGYQGWSAIIENPDDATGGHLKIVHNVRLLGVKIAKMLLSKFGISI